MNPRLQQAFFVLALVLLPQTSGCDFVRKLHGRPAVERPVAPAQVSVKMRNLQQQQTERVVAPGMVEPWRGQIDLSPHEPGSIAEVLVSEGESVKAGQVLAILDDEAQRAAVDVARADVAEVEAALTRTVRGATQEELQQARADAEAYQVQAARAERDAERMVKLGAEAAISPAEVDRARTDARAQLALAAKSAARLTELNKGARSEDRRIAGNRLLAAKGRLELALANLEHRHVAAPADATVLQSRYHAGEYFNVGSAPLFVLGDVSRLQVRLEVDEIDAFRVQPGQPCELYGDDDDRLAAGAIFRLAPKMGRRALGIESPTARADVRVREVFVEVAATEKLVPGRRVWGHVQFASR